MDFQGRYIVRTAPGEASVAPQNEFWRLRQFDGAASWSTRASPIAEVTGQVEVAVNVPPGGWAAVDLLKERPVAQAEPSLAARVRQWWLQLTSSENAKPAETQTFATGKKAWILWLDKTTPAVSRNQQSYRNVLDTFGYDIKLVKPGDSRAFRPIARPFWSCRRPPA